MRYRLSVLVLCIVLAAAAAAGLAWLSLRGPSGPDVPKIPTVASPGTEFLVAAVQCPSRMGDVEGNCRRLERLVREAASHGAKIIVLPEASVTGYLSQDLGVNWHLPGRPLRPDFTEGRSPEAAAQTVPGKTTARFGRLARVLGVYIVVTFVEIEKATGRYFNTACLIGPRGRILLHYRKLHPWPYPEDSWTTPGDRGLAIAETPYGRLGLLICYDIHDVPPLLAERGVETLLYPIAWVDDEESTWFDVGLPAEARRHGVNIVGANWSVEKKQDWPGYGMSRIIDREGKILAAAKGDLGEEILYARLSVAPREPSRRPTR